MNGGNLMLWLLLIAKKNGKQSCDKGFLDEITSKNLFLTDQRKRFT